MRNLRFAGRAGLSFFSYNVGWWVCAFGVNYGYPWLGPASLPLWIGLHLRFSPTPKGELLFFTVLTALGFAVDSALIRAGLFSIPGDGLGLWAPAWLVAMWILLGFTFESLLPWRPKRWAFLLIGMVSGPLTYIWCDAIKIMEYARPLWLSVLVHALLWAALTPLLFRIRDFCLMALQPIVPAAIPISVSIPVQSPELARLGFLESPASATPEEPDRRIDEAPSVER